jgi:hypothetical protein
MKAQEYLHMPVARRVASPKITFHILVVCNLHAAESAFCLRASIPLQIVSSLAERRKRKDIPEQLL